uniref:Uncharacterized protein n=1 Tax=Rhizophora mucronata TaxID=61149 RepID=A0A2P2IX87_RHIMU
MSADKVLRLEWLTRKRTDSSASICSRDAIPFSSIFASPFPLLFSFLFFPSPKK